MELARDLKKLKKRSERAVEALQKYESDELIQKQNNFILSAGGSVEEIKPEELKQVEEKDKTPTAEITRNLLLQNKTLAEVATERGLTLGTIITHLESIKKLDKNFDFSKLNIIEADAPKDSKVTRVYAAQAFLESGRVFLIKGLWNDGYLLELTQFPNGAHDDQVDVTIMAREYFDKQNKLSIATLNYNRK